MAALVAGGLGGGLGYTLAEENDSGGSTTVSSTTSGGNVKRDPGTVAAVAAAALPSTVTIEAASSSGEGGTGTGFVFDKQGHIVTNNHVVADAVDGGNLTATFPNGKKYDAEVVGNAQGYDVAVIKLKNAPSDLKPLTLGNSDDVAVGDSTIAIGAPFGLSNTVTTGIISAKNRPVASSDGSGSKASYMSALQTDASINPGNSGGPLLDAQGNVIGINSAIQSTSNGGFGTGQAYSIGLGFAIPINQAKYVAQELIETGKPVYAKIGASVSLEDTTNGAQITEQGVGGAEPVDPGGPADKARPEAGRRHHQARRPGHRLRPHPDRRDLDPQARRRGHDHLRTRRQGAHHGTHPGLPRRRQLTSPATPAPVTLVPAPPITGGRGRCARAA